MILFLLVIGAVAYFIIRHFDHAQSHLHGHVSTRVPRPRTVPRGHAEDAIRQGEIDEDEFSRRMTLLKDHQSVS